MKRRHAFLRRSIDPTVTEQPRHDCWVLAARPCIGPWRGSRSDSKNENASLTRFALQCLICDTRDTFLRHFLSHPASAHLQVYARLVVAISFMPKAFRKTRANCIQGRWLWNGECKSSHVCNNKRNGGVL
jgi:hypothetical protein